MIQLTIDANPLQNSTLSFVNIEIIVETLIGHKTKPLYERAIFEII